MDGVLHLYSVAFCSFMNKFILNFTYLKYKMDLVIEGLHWRQDGFLENSETVTKTKYLLKLKGSGDHDRLVLVFIQRSMGQQCVRSEYI